MQTHGTALCGGRGLLAALGLALLHYFQVVRWTGRGTQAHPGGPVMGFLVISAIMQPQNGYVGLANTLS